MESSPSSQRKRDKIFKRWGKNSGKPDAQNSSKDAIALRPKASLDDTSKLDAGETAAAISEPPKVATDDLWAEAYEKCKSRETKLIGCYEQQMKAFTSSAGTATDDGFSPDNIARLIKAKREDRDAQRLTFRLRGETITIRKQGEKIVKFVLWFNSTISSALASQPYASLAWSGVSIILPLVLNPSKRSQEMMDGLQKISNLMTTGHFREKLFPQGACTELRNASVELYSIIFEYQARCVCHLSLRPAERALKDIFETNDWTGMLDKIDKAGKEYTNLLDLFDKSKEHEVQELQARELNCQTKKLEEFQKKFLETQQYNLEAKLMASLASDYENDKDTVAPRVEGTCEWFINDERFRRWRNNECSSLLWISAGPGCGKSVLARTLIDECQILAASALHTTTCYFFFKEGENQRTKPANALGAILHQLFKQNPQLTSNALSSFKSYGDGLSNIFSELWKVLIKTAEDESAGHVICVLDALDECEEKSIQMLIDKIIDCYRHGSQHSCSAALKFLVTSRPYSRVRSAFEDLSGVNEYVHLDGDERSTDISNEINLVIDYRVPRMTRGFEIQDRQRISNRLKEMKHRTYLWLHLTLNIIDREREKFSKPSKIETLLSNLPVDVSDAYERILLQSNDKESARILLQIIIAKNDEPLTLAEANVALAIATQDRKPRDLDELDLWPEKRFKSTVQDMSGLFVSVHDGRLSLIHQTTRQFLLQGATESSDVSTGSKNWGKCFTVQCAHEILCSICIDYLTLYGSLCQTASSKQQRDYAGASSGALVFFDYAARNWALHYKEAPQQRVEALDTPRALASFDYATITSRPDDKEAPQQRVEALQTRAAALCKPGHNLAGHWFPYYVSKKQQRYRSTHYTGQDWLPTIQRLCDAEISDWSAIGIASVLGLTDIVQYMLIEANEFDQRAGQPFGTAVRVAIVMDRLEILRLLCQYSPRCQQDPRSGYSAIRVQNADILLFAEPFPKDVAKLNLSNELDYATSYFSSLESIRILLEHGAEPGPMTLSGFGTSPTPITQSDRNDLLVTIWPTDKHWEWRSEVRRLLQAFRGNRGESRRFRLSDFIEAAHQNNTSPWSEDFEIEWAMQ